MYQIDPEEKNQLFDSLLEIAVTRIKISESLIQTAKDQTDFNLRPTKLSFENDDRIRVAYEFLDAQVKTKIITRGGLYKLKQWKTQIRCWSGFKVSQEDVEVAAHIHPEIKGQYPHYNISSMLTLPFSLRLANFKPRMNWGFKLEDSIHEYRSYETLEDFLIKKLSSPELTLDTPVPELLVS